MHKFDYKKQRIWSFLNISEYQILANKLSAKRLPKAFNDILVEELSEKGETLVRRSEELGNIIYYGMNVSIYTEILSDVLQGNVPPEFSDGIFALLKGVRFSNNSFLDNNNYIQPS